MSRATTPQLVAELAPLDPAEARRLTDLAKRNASELWAELLELYNRGAHSVLGHASWQSYCAAEFGFRESQSYRLLEAARVAQVVPQLGNEAQARALAPLLRQQNAQAVREVVDELAAQHGDQVTAAHYKHAVAQRIAISVSPASNRVSPLPAAAESELGQVYHLGPHRLICGDSRDPAVLAALFGDKRAAMIWTDPPYGVNYVGKTADALRIQNDRSEGLRQLLNGAWRAAAPLLIESAPFYVAGPTGPTAEDFYASFRETGWNLQLLLIWVKSRMVMGRLNYHLQHEVIYHGHAPGRTAGRMTADRFRWYGPDNATTILTVDTPSASPDHPTTKPIELIIPGIQNSSLPGEIVFDPFAGSGSTMLAAEQARRRAYMVELEPRYCDVIRGRWHELEAAHESNRRPSRRARNPQQSR